MQRSKKRLWIFPLVALLLGLGAWFMSRGEAPPPAPARQVSFPTEMTPRDHHRAQARQTHRFPPPSNVEEAQERQEPVDPLHAVLPTNPEAGAVVLEANAIRNSPLGETLIACMGEDLFALSKERTGVDLLTDLDRVALTTEGVSVTGHFANADWDTMFPEAERSAYGERGRIYAPPPVVGSHDEDRDQPTVGVWGEGMVIMGTPEQVEAAIDRLEGRGPPGTPILQPTQAYGEVYGVLGAEALAQLLGAGELGEQLPPELLSAARQLELHADTLSDVGMVARFQGDDPRQVQDLGQAFKGLLSVARAKAQLEGEEEAVRLLDMAKVSGKDGNFDLQVAIPESFLAEMAEQCRRDWEAHPTRARPETSSSDAAGDVSPP